MDAADLEKLAHQFMINTVKAGPGKNIWIEHMGPNTWPLAQACIAAVKAVGGNPFSIDRGSDEMNVLLPSIQDQMEEQGQALLEKMKTMQGYIRIRDDADQLKSTVSSDLKQAWSKAIRPMTDWRVNNTDWLVVSAPTEDFAAACHMPVADCEQFYLDVCLLDYGRMAEAVEPLKKIMAEGKKVHIKGKDTDLTFSIEGIPAVPCTGASNIPDGECFTAPVKNSINGKILFGPSIFQSEKFEFIRLEFKDGRIINAEAENDDRTRALNKILDADEGARFVGEFAIAFNPFIFHPIGDILFDEKISGSLHFAMGGCYDDAPNGNKSDIHWDMVHIQRPEYGGGEIWIDDRLIRKDGLFVVPELFALNPDNLKTTNKIQPSRLDL